MYLLDTNAVIDFLNGKLPHNGKLLLMKIEPKISVITKIELFASSTISEQEKKILSTFTSNTLVYDTINEAIVSKTTLIRQLYKIKLPDAIISATAIVNNLTLVTRNNKDFERITELKIINPHQL